MKVPVIPKIRRRIDSIIVHCSATPERSHFTVEDIDRWHRKEGYAGCGYHYVVYLDGSIHKGRALWKPGAHCFGHNACSIGVCYIGGVARDGHTPKDTRTPEQKEALLTLLQELKKVFPMASIHGHYEYAAKACPSFDVSEYRELFD